MGETEREPIARHGLEPHPEGGHSAACMRRRPTMTAIRYLLGAGARSERYGVDADEAWHWQQGGVLELLQFDAARGSWSRTRLGPPPAGEARSCIVPAGTWQSAHARDAWVLVACTVAPGFVWEGFELLDQGSDLVRNCGDSTWSGTRRRRAGNPKNPCSLP